jgi:hypothetical protein
MGRDFSGVMGLHSPTPALYSGGMELLYGPYSTNAILVPRLTRHRGKEDTHE